MSEDEYNRLLKQFPEKLQGALTWKKYLERLSLVGRRTGRTDRQIGDDIRKELRGQLDDRTIRHYLPTTFKHMEHASEHKEPEKIAGSEPNIPPPPQVIKEAESEPEKEFIVEKVDEYIAAVPDVPIETEIILNCKKFGTELRLGLLNNSNLKLYIRNNQVSKIL